MEPVNLKPTNYCTAMWNGVRCDGKHDQQWGSGVVHSVCGEGGSHSMWRDGYGGIRSDEVRHPSVRYWTADWQEIKGLDLKPWPIGDDEVPYLLSRYYKPVSRQTCECTGPDFDLRLSDLNKDRSITYAGQLAAIGTWGLLDTLAPLDSDWSAVDPQWEMSTGSFTIDSTDYQVIS